MAEAPLDIVDPWNQTGLILDHRFRLERPIGAGPIHLVFAAHDILEQQTVCLKLPRRELRHHEGFTERYRRDILRAMLHTHPGWVTPWLLGEHEGAPFQVLPLLHGQTLPQWFRACGRDHEALLEVLKTALYHLAQLHRVTGSLHGGIKPENLLIADQQGPVFLDLVATGRLEDQFADRARRGEPVYFSPEQLVGERAGPASDVYSLGLVLYAALAGRHPFANALETSPGLGHPERLLSSMLSQLQERPPAPSSFREDVPRWADRFLARCLRAQPQERFTGPEEALEWLRHHGRGGATEIHPRRPLPPAGREAEMSFLLECLDSLQGATPQGDILRLHGPPGVGKTRCTEWLKEQARQRKLRVVEVRRAPESGLHLQSVANALSRSHSGRDHAAGATRPVVEELIEAALESPLLLVLDDLADADETLVRLLEELHTVVAELPLLVVLSEDGSPSRDEAMAHFLERLDHVVLLSPLDRRAIANLIEERAWCPPAPGFVAWMHQVSQGNALAARLLLDFLQAHGALREGLDLDWATSPYPERPDLDHLLQWKLSSVSPVTHSLLETAAVLGDPFNLSTLQAITYRPPEEVDTALSEAVKAEVIEDGSDPSGATVFRWCHPLLRRTLWDRIPRRRRQRIHRLAAAFYSRGEPEPAKLAYHFGQSDDARELFFWGIRAVQKALGQGRRGEANFWLHTLLGRLEEERWLGPQPHQLREALARDQLEERAVEVWRRWFLALAGRWDGDPQELLPHEPLLFTQLLLEAAWPAERWRPAVSQALAEIAAPGRTPPPATAALYRKAVELLRQEWLARLGGGKPFPEGTD